MKFGCELLEFWLFAFMLLLWGFLACQKFTNGGHSKKKKKENKHYSSPNVIANEQIRNWMKKNCKHFIFYIKNKFFFKWHVLIPNTLNNEIIRIAYVSLIFRLSSNQKNATIITKNTVFKAFFFPTIGCAEMPSSIKGFSWTSSNLFCLKRWPRHP